MATTVDLGKVTGAQGPQGVQGPQGPQGPTGPKGDSYITKYVVNSSNKSVSLSKGVYAVKTDVSGREQITVKFSNNTAVDSLAEHKTVTDMLYGITLAPGMTIQTHDLFVLSEDCTATASRAQGTSSVTFYKIG